MAMKKKIILFFMVLLLLSATVSLRNQTVVQVTRANLWEDIFQEEPVEKAILLFSDGELFIFNSYESSRVAVPVSYVFEDLGYKPQNALFIIHNHLTNARFSEADKGFNQYLARRGFGGRFLLRTGNDQIFEMLPDGAIKELK